KSEYPSAMQHGGQAHHRSSHFYCLILCTTFKNYRLVFPTTKTWPSLCKIPSGSKWNSSDEIKSTNAQIVGVARYRREPGFSVLRGYVRRALFLYNGFQSGQPRAIRLRRVDT
ncbi:hypothetical protein L9F63_019082, partial [Diploptera punctata]